MAIVKMKRLHLIALREDRDRLLRQLLHVGCVEVREPDALPEEAEGLLRRDASALAEAKGRQAQLKQALTGLHRLAPQKGGLFTPRGVMTEEELLDPAALQRALDLAEEINGHVKEIGACAAREKRL